MGVGEPVSPFYRSCGKALPNIKSWISETYRNFNGIEICEHHQLLAGVVGEGCVFLSGTKSGHAVHTLEHLTLNYKLVGGAATLNSTKEDPEDPEAP